MMSRWATNDGRWCKKQLGREQQTLARQWLDRRPKVFHQGFRTFTAD